MSTAGTGGSAIVTGAGSPVGRAVVRRLAKAGVSLIACDTREADLADFASELKLQGRAIIALVADPAQRDGAERLAQAAMAEFGRIDSLVNGLDEESSGDWLGESPDGLAAGIGAGPERVLLAVRAVLPHMVAVGGGRIVNVVSSLGRYRSAWFRGTGEGESAVVRAGSESAVVGLTRQLAFELAPHRIRVNAVAAGWLRTPAGERAWQALTEREQGFVLDEISLKRLGEPDEIAAAVEFLATDQSRYVTGTTIDVNGGWWVS